MSYENPTNPKAILRWGRDSIAIDVTDKNLDRSATYWNRIVKSKGRWLSDPEAIRAHSQRAIEDLKSFGISEDQIREIANANHVEISIYFESDNKGNAERDFPWEFVLLRAAQRVTNRTNLVITRHLKRETKSASPEFEIKKVLFVESVPGRLSGEYIFDVERDHIRNLFTQDLDGKKENFRGLKSPTTDKLLTTLHEMKPEVVHLSGIDAHEGRAILSEVPDEINVRDGFYLKGETGQAEAIDYLSMAGLLNKTTKKPVIVSFNCQFSGRRLAALSVAKGSSFSIGILGESDEIYVENFFFKFYQLVLETHHNVFSAFTETIRSLENVRDDLDATHIVLWSAESFYETFTAAVAQQEIGHPTSFQKGKGDDLHLEIKPYKELNYSMLHNGQGLFSVFKLEPRRRAKFRDVEVKVELQLGAEKFPCRKLLTVEKSMNLSELITVPLTWSFLSSIKESINTTIYVEINYNNEPVYSETHRVIVHPLNDWKDNERDGGWLPCFVLPLDPSVQEIINSARRNLRIITDDAIKTFDGYQSCRSAAVDLQARAIWSALALNYNIDYIDPPPAYAEQSQRLRIPSQVVQQRNGTCIDLALTYAACLEYVGLFPVIFLTKNHAFAGYWRNSDTFQKLANNDWTEADTSDRGGEELDQDPPASFETNFRAFEFKKSWYLEIVKFINKGDLVPIETTFITESKGFEYAKERGLHKLSIDHEFESMLDIRKARRVKVTPLPIQIKEHFT